MIDEKIVRDFAAELIRYACGQYTGGRSENDPVYQRVTESRDVGAAQRGYSSCGDLAHWMLFRLGSRARFVNRKEHRGWRMGANVSALAFSPVAEDAKANDHYQAGDVLIIWIRPDATDAHVMVALDHRQGMLTSGEYGQPGGAVRVHHLDRPGFIGQRKIQKVIRLNRALAYSEERGELAEPDYTTLPEAALYLATNGPQSQQPS
jgi:hypothetical protein